MQYVSHTCLQLMQAYAILNGCGGRVDVRSAYYPELLMVSGRLI